MSGNFINNYPYTDFHELNLDWILNQMKNLNHKMDTFDALNNITWKGIWSIQNPYDIWSIVQDNEGNAYISTQAVPSGVEITNKNYWTQVAMYDQIYKDFQDRINKNSANLSAEAERAKTQENLLHSQILQIINSDASPKVVNSTIDMKDTAKIYILSSNGHIYFYDGNNFVDSGLVYGANKSYEINSTIVNPSNYKTLLPDLNNIISNSVYTIVPTADGKPANFPEGAALEEYYTLITTIAGNAAGGTLQVLICRNGDEYLRYKAHPDSWNNWLKLSSSSYEINSTIVNPSNYKTLLPDLNNIISSSVYTIVPTADGKPANFPEGAALGEYYTLITTNAGNAAGGTLQVLICGNGDKYERYKKSPTVWNPWHNSNTPYIVSKTNGDFNSVLEAVFVARQFKNSHVLVTDGVYDEIQEFKNHFGNDYFDKYVRGYDKTDEYQGLNLYNGITLEFTGNAKYTCLYDGGNSEVVTGFSMFNLYYSDAALLYVNAEATNIRYIVHDDPLANKDHHWLHKIIGCHLKINNSANKAGKITDAVIGGGLGKDGVNIVKNCTFESVGINNNYTNVNYHNCVLNNSKSSVYILNNYFVSGTVGGTWYGPSTEKSKFIITGNHLNAPIVHRRENTEYDVDNIEIISWNNEITN